MIIITVNDKRQRLYDTTKHIIWVLNIYVWSMYKIATSNNLKFDIYGEYTGNIEFRNNIS